MAFKNIVYSLCQLLITRSTNDGTSLDWKALVKCWNLRVCVWIKWGTSLLVICSLGGLGVCVFEKWSMSLLVICLLNFSKV
jgi:hypothetical protein